MYDQRELLVNFSLILILIFIILDIGFTTNSINDMRTMQSLKTGGIGLLFLTITIMFRSELVSLYTNSKLNTFLYIIAWIFTFGVSAYYLTLIIKYKQRCDSRQKYKDADTSDTSGTSGTSGTSDQSDPCINFTNKSTMIRMWLYISTICSLIPFSRMRVDIGSNIASLSVISSSLFAFILTLLQRDDVYGLSDG